MKNLNIKAKNKVLALAFLMAMIVSTFAAINLPMASASNETISISVNDGTTTNFAVHHCVTGYHVNDYYSTAAIAVSFDTEQTGFLTWAHVHLIRVVKFYPASGSVITSGEINLQEYTWTVTGGSGQRLTHTFYDNLNLAGLNYGASHLPDTWEDYLVEVSYTAYWYWEDHDHLVGWSNWVEVEHDERYVDNNFSWDPICAPQWAASASGETYGTGSTFALSSMTSWYKPDGSSGYIDSGSTTGSYGRVYLTPTQVNGISASVGTVYAKCYTGANTAHIQVYAKDRDSQQWSQLYNGYLYQPNPGWVNFGNPGIEYDQLLFVAYKGSGDAQGRLYIDCLSLPYYGYF